MTTEQRRAAGRRINPTTADVWFVYGQIDDPYGELGADGSDSIFSLWIPSSRSGCASMISIKQPCAL
jgi:hypothetical protein